MASIISRYRFTVDDYELMGKFGILDENDRVELIRGEIINKMTIGDSHAACVKRLNRLLNGLIGTRVVIGIQDPVRLDDSVPEPDVSILQPRDDLYKSATPRPADVILLIEVADSTLDIDRDTKGPLYAEAGIPEYWIVNLNGDVLEVHRQPRPDGSWGDVRLLRRGQTADVAGLPGLSVTVDDIL
jgi:Uma2 family endonuclease